ncbi:MAG TPA: hypothetical protein VD864_08190 [Nocardioides sp.]|nr:hypothetical protein [Nocardioides sp.]
MGDVKSLSELLAEPPRRGDWGPWLLDEEHAVLYLPNDEYWIELPRSCTTAAAVLDWIFQLVGKTWVDDRTLVGLIRALDDVLHPQATLCSMGVASSLRPDEIRRQAAEVAKWLPYAPEAG